MNVGEPQNPSSDVRPIWWKVALACAAGVSTGTIAYLTLLWPFVALLDLIVGRSDWQEDVRTWPAFLQIPALIIFWVPPLALGQWVAAWLCGWRKSVYFAAAIQTLQMAILLLALPVLIALSLTWLNIAHDAARRGRTREAKHPTLFR